MFRELRDFLFRVNVVDLAVAVVIAGAFGAVVASFVADILTPLLGIIGVPDFSTLAITINEAEIRYGVFLNTVITFLLIGASVFLFVVKPMQRMTALRKKEETAAPAGPTELEVLTEIRDELRKRPA
jgi:large conductance mechanosensitive channel